MGCGSDAFVTPAQRPDLAEQVRRQGADGWPEFPQHGAVCGCYWQLLYRTFAHWGLNRCCRLWSRGGKD
jgi:hypothetical protein